MKKYSPIILAVILVISYFGVEGRNFTLPGSDTSQQEESLTNSASIIEEAFRNKQSDLQVKGVGKVVKVLPDDDVGSRHQKFILRLSDKQTLLVAHNIDLAPRIRNLRVGDTVEFHGEYEWNAKGGVLHWTHHDPRKLHVGGWLKHKGKTYE